MKIANISLFSRLFSQYRTTGIDNILKVIAKHHPKADLSGVTLAYKIASECHKGQKRCSGEEYISHPVAVAEILSDLGMGPNGVSAGLLHDTVEDTDFTIDQVSETFGQEVALLVDGVTKLDRMKYGVNVQSESWRKMIVAISKDIRVLVIKLADRLHNARTWGFVPIESAKRKARETLEIYAPLSGRLGIQNIKTELEDLSFMVLEPKIYQEILELVNKRSPRREKLINEVRSGIDDELKLLRIRGKVSGRPKEIYSIYQKMVLRGHSFSDIQDLVAFRIVVPTLRDCYAVLGSMHTRWTPMQGRFKDYIATPKSNFYQSIHTTVMLDGGFPVEIQIRTPEMHRQAEFGIAAHWKYKEKLRSPTVAFRKTAALDHESVYISRIADWQESSDSNELLENMRYELSVKDIYVFTPAGKLVGLPAGSTPVDFAYAVHTEVGHRTVGAKVNSSMVSLDTPLSTGDVVEVLTIKSANYSPNKNWLEFVKSTRARNKIKSFFTKSRREEAIELGKNALLKCFRKRNVSVKYIQKRLPELLSSLRFSDINDVYRAVGEGRLKALTVVDTLSKLIHDTVEDETSPIQVIRTDKPATDKPANEPSVLVRGIHDILVRLARCCTPVPGDEIIGYVTRGTGVSVHIMSCGNISHMPEKDSRLVKVEWSRSAQTKPFRVSIQIDGLNRPDLINDITKVFSEYRINILSANLSTNQHRASNKFVCEAYDVSRLEKVMSEIRKIDSVYDCYRA
ncbi:RelA/SpoT family protein [Tropheryma whipplei]|uniref:RelA/SpoT family protein n=1 Tax=Tropheryma whipplei TaxID=2039 RepID=UPI0004B2565D|nr:bifunctional (p)ppGpp synthetase/guanosine-3',5'-bis(diphosphate) 3'-pyrophosphohydrolase [Tropheryma whipplei]